jgi:hypothetical protein
MTVPPEVEAQILRLHHVENGAGGTIARQLPVHRGTGDPGAGPGRSAQNRSAATPWKVDPYLPLILETLQKYPKHRQPPVRDGV